MPTLRVETLVAANPSPLTLDGTRTYIVGQDPCAVIDPGPALGEHLDAVEVAIGAAEVAAICITHWHPDHAAGAAELRLRTGAPLAALRMSTELAALDPPDIRLADGTAIEVGGGSIVAVETPGHTPDHMCFHAPRDRALFSGDTILGEGTSMIAPPEGDMVEYMASLERLKDLNLELIYPGHGPPIEDAPAKIQEYIAHREARERQVIEALRAGAATPAEIRALVYPDLDSRLTRAAEGSVAAHLAKLVAEGRAAEGDGRYAFGEAPC